MNLAERLGTEDADFILVPSRQDVAHLAICGGQLDLQEALLPAIVAFGPARASLQAQVGRADNGAERGVLNVYGNGGGLARLRAGDEVLAAVTRYRADGQRHHEIDDGESDDGDDQISLDRHLSPPALKSGRVGERRRVGARGEGRKMARSSGAFYLPLSHSPTLPAKA